MPYANAAKAAGKHVFHLNIGQPDLPTPQHALDTLKQTKIETLAYSPSEGYASYREALAGYYATCDIQVNAEDILITTGGSEGINFAMMSCLDAGDGVIIPEPFYANYRGFSQAAGVIVQPITASIETGFALPPIAAFEEAIQENTKAILICNPSNPTGYLYSEEELLQLKEIVLKHDLYLIVDEVYREFTYDGKKHTSVLSLDGLEQHVIVIDSISKRYSACGARIGAMVTRNTEVRHAALKFAQARLSPPSLAQILGESLVSTPPSYLEDAITEYDKRRKLTVKRLQAMDGVTCPTPGGAFYVLVELPVDSTEKFCQWLLEEYDRDGKTLMMAPGSGFYSTPKIGDRQARIAYVLNEDDLNAAMDCLEAALKAYQSS